MEISTILILTLILVIAYLTYKYLVAMAALRLAISSEESMRVVLRKAEEVSSKASRAYFEERVKRIEYMRNI